MTTANEDYINQMYDNSLQSQKNQLEADYNENLSNLEQEKQKAQKQADESLARTYVEAAKAQKGYNEVQSAYGLTSGAMAQARLAQDNQLQADLTTIRAAQQTVDADVERQRTLLAQEYAAAIAQARADNDLQRAQALYEEAKEAEDRLLQQQKEAASLMAGAGDYSLYQTLYGLTDEQLAKLQGTSGSGDGDGGSQYVGTPIVTDDGGGNDNLPEYTAEELAAMDYVDQMLTGLSKNGSMADPARIIAGTNALDDSQRDFAQAYLEAVLAAGAMK